LLLLIIIKSEQKYTAYFTAQSDITVVAAAAELRTKVTPAVLAFLCAKRQTASGPKQCAYAEVM
jgi:hypothetical protein